MPAFRTLDDLDVRSKHVLVRVDLNVPMKDGKPSDTTRIDRVAPTIDERSERVCHGEDASLEMGGEYSS